MVTKTREQLEYGIRVMKIAANSQVLDTNTIASCSKEYRTLKQELKNLILIQKRTEQLDKLI